MGAKNSKSGGDDDQEQLLHAKEALNELVSDLSQARTPCDAAVVCVRTIDKLLGWFGAHLTNLQQWDKVKRAELRAQLSAILKSYSQLMADTGKLAASIFSLATQRTAALKKLHAIKMMKGHEVQLVDVLSKVDVNYLKKGFELQDIPKLLERYEVLINQVCEAQAALKQDAKEAKKKMWKCIGLTALATVGLALSVAVIVLSGGTAAPAVVPIGKGVATATAGAVGLFSATGTAVGVAGAVGSAVTMIASSAVAVQLADLSCKLEKTQKSLVDVDKQLVHNKSVLESVEGILIAEAANTSAVVSYMVDIFLFNSLEVDKIAEAMDNNVSIEKAARALHQNVQTRGEEYRKNLVAIQVSLRS